MIRVNLLGEKKDNTAANFLQLAGFCLTMLIIVGSCIALKSSASTQLEQVQSEKEILDARLAKLRKKTKKVDELEKKKKFLSDKLTTIAKLKAKRQGPVQVLDNITVTIPERAWVTSLSQSTASMEFKGLAIDPQTVSEFMRRLGDSVFFTKVDLDFSRQFIRDGVKLQEFSIVANLVDALELQALLNKPKEEAEEAKES